MERKDLQFTDRVIGSDANMLLNAHIGYAEGEPFIDPSNFSQEMYYWKSQGYDVKVKINSVGGSVMGGWDMVDAVRETKAETINIGLAASMAGIVLMFGEKRKAYDYATCMIHAPRGGNKQFLEIVRGQFKELLENRTKFSKEEIEEMMESGKDYFFDASQMLEKGIIDEIIPTSKKVKIPANASPMELFAVYNSLNKNGMESIWNKIFKGKTDEESVANAYEIKNKAEQLEKENTSLKEKLNAAEVKAKEADAIINAEKAKNLIEGAISAGKLKAEVKDVWVKNATANFEDVKSMLEGMVTIKEGSIQAETKPSNVGMTYEELAKRDPKKLAEIAENDPELFNKLQDEYLKK